MRSMRTGGGRVAARAAGLATIAALVLAPSAPAEAQNAVAQPPELLVTVAIGPDNTLDNLRAYANNLRPGLGAMLGGPLLRRQVGKMATATSLDGVDDAATMYVLAVDGGPAIKGVAAVVRITDDKAFSAGLGAAHAVRKGGWAVVGPKLVAEKVAPFALGTLAPQPGLAGAPTATIHTQHILQRYRTDIEAARKKLVAAMAAVEGSQMGAMAESYVDGLVSALADSDRVIVSFDLTKDIAAIDLAVVPKPGTRLAKFVALQQPSDYGLLAKLPASPSAALLAGHIESGPYRTAFLELANSMLGKAAPRGMTAAMAALLRSATGDLAMTMDFYGPGGMQMTQIFGLTDARGAEKGIALYLDALKKPVVVPTGDLTSTIQASPKATVHDGVTIRGFDTAVDFSQADPAKKAVLAKAFPNGRSATRAATFDQLGVVVTGEQADAGTATAIDAARGKGKRLLLPTIVNDLLAASRVRKESFVMTMDIGALVAAATGTTGGPARPFMFSLGFADRNAHLRITLPASTFRGLAPGGP